jgi:hypothetical protein
MGNGRKKTVRVSSQFKNCHPTEEKGIIGRQDIPQASEDVGYGG